MLLLKFQNRFSYFSFFLFLSALVIIFVFTYELYIKSNNRILSLEIYNKKLEDLVKSQVNKIKENYLKPNYSTTPVKLSYLAKYPFLLNCRTEYNEWKPNRTDEEIYNFSSPSPSILNEKRIVRGIVVHFPIDKSEEFKNQLRWLYNSWIYMQKFESTKWRTDLVIFTENISKIFSQKELFLNQLNCSFSNRRTSANDKPMCTLIDYKPINQRSAKKSLKDFSNFSSKEVYNYFLNELNIFSSEKTDFIPYYNYIIAKTSNYPNIDSVLVAFDGYDYFKSAGFDFLLRTDMDVF